MVGYNVEFDDLVAIGLGASSFHIHDGGDELGSVIGWVVLGLMPRRLASSMAPLMKRAPTPNFPSCSRGAIQGHGVSLAMLTALRDNARRLGFTTLYAPIRPTDKHREPLTPFSEYVARRRADGQPHDAWVRSHLRLGATVVKVAPCSMVIAGTLAEWREWTGLSFDKSGIALVPGALSPVHVSREQDHAVYVEPNLWVRHSLG